MILYEGTYFAEVYLNFAKHRISKFPDDKTFSSPGCCYIQPFVAFIIRN